MLDTSNIPQPFAPTTFPTRSYARHNHEDNIKRSQNFCDKKHYQSLFSKYEVMAWKALLEMKSDIQDFDRELLLEELQKLQKLADEESEIEHVTADVVKLDMQDKELEATIAAIAGTCGLFVSTDLTNSTKNNEISRSEFKFERETLHTGETEALDAHAEETTESTARKTCSEMTEDINTEEWREENQETASGKVYHQTAEIAGTMSNAAKRKLSQELVKLELEINSDMNTLKQRKEYMETIMTNLQNDHAEEKAIMLDANKNEIITNMTNFHNDPIENRAIMFDADNNEIRQKIDALEADIEDDIVMQEWKKSYLEATLAELQEEIRLEETRNKELEGNIHGIRGRLINTQNDIIMQECRKADLEATLAELQEHIRLEEIENKELEGNIHAIRGRLINTQEDIVMQECRKADLEATLAELQEEIRLEEIENKELEGNIHAIRGRLINTQEDIVMQECRKRDLEATLADLQEHIRLEQIENKELEDNIHGIRGRLINTLVQTEICDAEDNPCAWQLTMPGVSCLHGRKCWKH